MDAGAMPELDVPPNNEGPTAQASRHRSSERPHILGTTYTVRPRWIPKIFLEKPITLNALHKDINERIPSDSPTIGGYTPLLLAVAIDLDLLVKLLLTRGADPQAVTVEGISVLHLAVESRHKYNRMRMSVDFMDWKTEWLKPWADINGPMTETMVHNVQNQMNIRLLLAQGANVNARDVWGFTPLHRACNVESRQSLIRLLIQSGANVNARSINGATPLHVAAEMGYSKTAKLLIRHGSQVNAATNEHRLTPLHLALIHHHQSMIALLLKRGADIEAKTSHGYMAIHLVALRDDINPFTDNIDSLTCLLRRGAPMDIPAGKDDQTPLHMACMRANNIAMKYLLRAGANVHARCKKGMTPLHTLVATNHENWDPPQSTSRMVDYLMRSGCDINIRDANGGTALHIACRVNSKKIADDLLGWNAAMFIKDKYNRTPLDYCHPESWEEFRVMFWPYVDRLRSLLQRPIGDDIWPQVNTRYCKSLQCDLYDMSCYTVGDDGTTLIDLMLKSAREMSHRVTAKQLQMIEQLIFVKGKINFPMYYVSIGQKIQAIDNELRKKDLRWPAQKALNKITGLSISDDCVSKLFEYLHANDLNNLISAVEHRFIMFAKDLMRRGPLDRLRSRGTKRCDAPKMRFSWWNVINRFESIYDYEL